MNYNLNLRILDLEQSLNNLSLYYYAPGIVGRWKHKIWPLYPRAIRLIV